MIRTSDKFSELQTLSLDSRKYFPHRLFIVEKNYFGYTVFSKDSKNSTLNIKIKNCFSFGFKPDRGKLLDMFSHFEFLLSQIIFARLNNTMNIDFWDKKKMREWNMVLSAMTLDEKIKFIKTIENNKTIIGKLDNLKGVRNSLAHEISLSYIEYLNGFLRDKNIYEQFQEDVYSVWFYLLDMYCQVWDQDILMDKLINDIHKDLQSKTTDKNPPNSIEDRNR